VERQPHKASCFLVIDFLSSYKKLSYTYTESIRNQYLYIAHETFLLKKLVDR
jgi:hypothetical protein